MAAISLKELHIYSGGYIKNTSKNSHRFLLPLAQHAAIGNPPPPVVHATTRKYRINPIYLHRQLEYVQKQNGLP